MPITNHDLRKAGLKVTLPRLKIIELLENSPERHWSAEEIYKSLLEQGEDAVSAESLAAADLTKVAWPGDAVATVAEGVDLAAAGADGVGATGKEA